MNTETPTIENQSQVEGGAEVLEQREGISEGLDRLGNLSSEIDSLASEIVDRSDKFHEKGTVVLGGSKDDGDETKDIKEIKNQAIEIIGSAESFLENAMLSLEVNALPNILLQAESSANESGIDDAEVSDNIIRKIATTLTKRAEGTDLSMGEEMDEEDRVQLQKELESIKESLAYVARGEDGAEKALHKIAGSLQVSRNKVEIATGPTTEANKEALQEEIKTLEERREKGTLPWLSYVIPGKKYHERVKIKNEQGEDEWTSYDDATIRFMGAKNGKNIEAYITDNDRNRIDQKIQELDNASRQETTDPARKEKLERKAANLVEMQNIVSETQKTLRKVDKAWKVGAMAAIEGLGLTQEEAKKFKINVEKQKQNFYRFELIKASRGELKDPKSDVAEFVRQAQAA